MPRRANNNLEEKVVITFDHPAITATTTYKVWKCTPGRAFVVDRVSYINPTGLAADATNAFDGAIKNGSTTLATLFNTDSGDAGGAALAADTFVEGTLVANTGLASSDVLTLVLTEEGTQTLPAGRVVIEGRLL